MTRLFLIFPFLGFLSHQAYQYAFYIFMFAGFTDGLDGFLARYFKWQSLLGSFIDPLSDKLLIASSYISLACLDKLPWWLVFLVFLRDLTISFGVLFWYYILHRQLNFKPTFLSKINTVLQIGLVTLCLFELAFFEINPALLQALILLTGFTTTITFIDYMWTWGRKAFGTNVSTS
jgi:cardiolipin synthase